MIIYIELGIHGDELHVGFVKRIQISDVAPIRLGARFHVVERVGKYAQLGDRWRNDVLAEIMAAVLILGILGEQHVEAIHCDDVDARAKFS